MSESNASASNAVAPADTPAPDLRPPLALFDLDGTLTDPALGITACIRHGLAEVGVDATEFEPLEQFIGPPLQESFRAMGLTADQTREAIAAYRERFAIAGMFENKVYDGIPELLKTLHDAGWQLGVATSKPEVFANKILETFDLDPFFATVAGATMDGTRRHKRDVVAHALATLDRADRPGRCTMIGDRGTDIEAAHAHGIGSIGVVWGYGPTEELIEAAPSALAGDPSELGDLLGVIGMS